MQRQKIYIVDTGTGPSGPTVSTCPSSGGGPSSSTVWRPPRPHSPCTAPPPPWPPGWCTGHTPRSPAPWGPPAPTPWSTSWCGAAPRTGRSTATCPSPLWSSSDYFVPRIPSFDRVSSIEPAVDSLSSKNQLIISNGIMCSLYIYAEYSATMIQNRSERVLFCRACFVLVRQSTLSGLVIFLLSIILYIIFSILLLAVQKQTLSPLWTLLGQAVP